MLYNKRCNVIEHDNCLVNKWIINRCIVLKSVMRSVALFLIRTLFVYLEDIL